MINLRQAVLLLLLPVFRAVAQDVPAATAPAPYTGFELPDTSGTLRLSASASDIYVFNYYGSGTGENTFSGGGAVAYLSSSAVHPFSMVYSGYFIPGNSTGPNRVISNLALSQVVTTGLWRFVVADMVSYLPGNPVTGLSGVPGVGDGNVPPVSGSTTGSDIETVDVPMLTNRVSGTAIRTLTAAASLSGTATESITRYLNVPGGSPYDQDTDGFSGTFRYRLDPFTTVGTSYSFSSFDYLAADLTVRSQSILFIANRQLTPNLTCAVAVGPQFTSSSNSAIEPFTTSYSASASLNYRSSILASGISYNHSVNSADGLIQGAETTNVLATISRQFGSFMHISSSVSYLINNSLQSGIDNTHSLVATGQVNRAIAPHLSAFVSYTAQHQLSQGSDISSLVLSGTAQTFSAGITYSPAAFHIGHQ